MDHGSNRILAHTICKIGYLGTELKQKKELTTNVVTGGKWFEREREREREIWLNHLRCACYVEVMSSCTDRYLRYITRNHVR